MLFLLVALARAAPQCAIGDAQCQKSSATASSCAAGGPALQLRSTSLATDYVEVQSGGRGLLPWITEAYPETIGGGETDGFPLVLQASGTGNLTDVLDALRPYLANISEYGAVLARGLPAPRSAEQMSHLGAALAAEHLGERREYAGGGTSKSRRSAFVRTASDEPHWQTMEPHQDMGHSSEFPLFLGFCVGIGLPAGVGGQTLLVDDRKVTQDLRDAGILDLFEQKGGVRYEKLFHSTRVWDGPMRNFSWQVRFFAETQEEVDAQFEGKPFAWSWREDGALVLRNTEPVVRTHPRTGEELWFNGVHTNHRSYYDDAKHIDTSQGPPMDTAFGDGDPIPADVMTTVRSTIWRNAVPVKLNQYDVLVVDNMRASHGRLSWAEGHPREMWQTHFAG